MRHSQVQTQGKQARTESDAGRLIWLISALSLYLLTALCLCARADVVELTDGRKLEGLARREGTGWAITDSADNITRVTDAEVVSVQKTGNLTPEQMAQSQLNTLRHETEAMSDASAAAEKFRKFIEKNKGATVAAEAAKDLEVWNERVSRKLIKAGAFWVTPEEYANRTGKSLTLIQEAREQYKQGRMRDAEATVGQILAMDPANVSGLYLKGLLLAKQDKHSDARKVFERVLELMPDHAASLNNLAVICWGQKLYQKALNTYDLAMMASPKNRPILDNVAEAIAAMPREARDNPNTKKLLKRFEEQDGELQKDLAERGLHRWGSTYVDNTQMEKVQAEQAKITAKIENLKQDYDRMRQRVRELDTAIQLNIERMRRIEADRWRMDATGAMVMLPLPAVYWEIGRENDILRADQKSLLEKIGTWDMRVREIQQQTPLPAYAGKQRLIESEGTPLKLPAGLPATRPTK